MRNALPAGEKFLIMKVAWGGKSLGGDFRPPSSVSSFDVFCQGKCVNEVGHFYQVLVDDVHKMLAPGNIAAMFPDLEGLTPRLAGLGWFQGWNVSNFVLATSLRARARTRARTRAQVLLRRCRASAHSSRAAGRMRHESDGSIRV